MITYLVSFIVVILFLLSIFDIWNRTRLEYQVAKKLPGPRIYPLIGNVPEIIFKNQQQTFEFMRTSTAKYKKSFRLWAFGRLHINVVRASDIQVLLTSTSHITKNFIYDFLHPALGTGLLTSTGQKWFARRRILTPAFHFSILQEFLMIFREESHKMVDMLREEKYTHETVLQEIIPRFTLDTICETAMGVKLDSFKEPDTYRQHLIKMGRLVVKRIVNVWMHSNFIYKISGFSSSVNKHVDIVHNFTGSVIDRRRQLFQDHSPKLDKDISNNGNIYFSTGKKRTAMLDTLLSAERNGSQIDENGIREEVDTFMFEGFDTTSTGLLFILFMLAHHKKWQDLAYDELLQILDGRNESDLTIQDYQEMKILIRIIKETLRLYPPVHFIGRELGEPLTIDGVTLPKNTQMHLYVFDIHRDPDVFVEPNKFDPDRFLPQNIDKISPFAYIPFSAGPRNCIGQKFAMLEMQTFITNILLNYELTPITKVEDVVFIADLILRSKNPIKVKFLPRKRLV